MRSGLVLVTACVVTAVAAAQQANVQQGPEQTATKARIIVSGPICPAGVLRARQQSLGGATVWTTAQEDLNNKFQGRAPGSMGVHVNFDSLKNPVQSVELSVSYLPLKLRFMPVVPGADTSGDPAKTFVLKQPAAFKIDGDLLVGPAATIQTVHLVSATFADGSVWHAPNEDSCTVEPNRVLPVNSKYEIGQSR